MATTIEEKLKILRELGIEEDLIPKQKEHNLSCLFDEGTLIDIFAERAALSNLCTCGDEDENIACPIHELNDDICDRINDELGFNTTGSIDEFIERLKIVRDNFYSLGFSEVKINCYDDSFFEYNFEISALKIETELEYSERLNDMILKKKKQMTDEIKKKKKIEERLDKDKKKTEKELKLLKELQEKYKEIKVN